MSKKFSKMLTMLISIAMLVTMMPVMSFAAAADAKITSQEFNDEPVDGKKIFTGTTIVFDVQGNYYNDYLAYETAIKKGNWYINGIKYDGQYGHIIAGPGHPAEGFEVPGGGGYVLEHKFTSAGTYMITAHTIECGDLTATITVVDPTSISYVVSTKTNGDPYTAEVVQNDSKQGQTQTGGWFKYFPRPTYADSNYTGDKVVFNYSNGVTPTSATFVCQNKNGKTYFENTSKEFPSIGFDSDASTGQGYGYIFFGLDEQDSTHWDLGEHTVPVYFDTTGNQIGNKTFKIIEKESGGSAQGGSDKPSDPVTTEEVQVQTEVKDGVVSAKIGDSDVVKLLENAKSGQVSIDVKTSSTVSGTNIELPQKLVKGINDTNAQLQIETSVGTVKFDAKALGATNGETVTLSINASQVEGENNATNYDITLKKSDDTLITQFGEGTVTLSLPLPAGVDAATGVKALYVNGKYVVDMNAVTKDGNAVFDTNHFSTYALMSKADANTKLVKSIKSSTVGTLKATGQKKKIKLTWKAGKGNTPTSYYVYRSTKKSSGFKKITEVKNGKKSYTDTSKKLKKGKKYYYKVIGKVSLDGKKYSTKASSVKSAKRK